MSVLLSPGETKEGVNWVGRTRGGNCDVVVEAMAPEERFCLGQDSRDGYEEVLPDLGAKMASLWLCQFAFPAWTWHLIHAVCPSWCYQVFLDSSFGQAVILVLFTCLSLPHPSRSWPFCPVLAGRPHCPGFFFITLLYM